MKLALAFVFLLGAADAGAQQVRIRVPAAAHFVGTPVDLQVVAEGFASQPAPQIHVEPPKGGRLDFAGTSPSVETSIRVINGVVSRSERVEFVFRYRFLATQPGRYRLGPFRVEQSGASATTRTLELEVRSVPRDERLRLRLVLPEGPVYPGQRVPIAIEWSFAAELRDRMQRYSISADLFQRTDAFRFFDPPRTREGTELIIETPEGRVAVRAVAEEIEGKEFVLVRAERIMVPLAPGTFELEPASVVVDEVIRWRGRSFLGSRVPAEVRKVRADDVPRSVVVLPLPTEGRPESFAGAVGQGFSLEVSADRSVVQVGDPIRLTLVVRGDGNLDAAGIPDLSADGGLSRDHFRLPQAEPSGRVEDGRKTFDVQVRALDESVREIPPLAYSFFDPERATFETVRSRPIALSVRPTTLVTASDVIASADAPAAEEGGADGRAPAALPGARVQSLSGANLSIVREPERLLENATTGVGALWGVTGLYVAGVGLLGLAVAARRRADVDPALLVRRRALAAERTRIARAAGRPAREGVATLASALRAMLRVAQTQSTPALEALIAECDARAFAPEGAGNAPLDSELQRRALGLADDLLGSAS